MTRFTAYAILIGGLIAMISVGYDITTAQKAYRAKIYPQYNVTYDPRLSGKVDRSAALKEEFALPYCLNGCIWQMNPNFANKDGETK